MCDVRPFRGLRYNLSRVRDLSSVISPPYDVVAPQERHLYHSRSPYNIIRLESGEERTGDSEQENKYTRASATLSEWLTEEVLCQERENAFYVVEHRFPYDDREKSRWGLLARIRLEEFERGHIRPHERTTKQPAADRLQLLRSVRANISPIMGLLPSHEGELLNLLRENSAGTPDLSAHDSYGVNYLLWAVCRKDATDRISGLFAGKAVYIADGHHRYETALRYRQEQASIRKITDDEAVNFVMMAIMDSKDPGLIMLPTHRLVRGLDARTLRSFESQMSPYFTTDTVLCPLPTFSDSMEDWLQTLARCGQGGPVLGIYGLDGQGFRVLRMRPDADLGKVMKEEEARLWKKLDVVLLQKIVLEGILGLDDHRGEMGQLEYTRDGLEARARVDSGEYQLAFYLNPAPVTSVFDSGDTGKRLPPKTTYFYPKTPAGLVLNPLWD